LRDNYAAHYITCKRDPFFILLASFLHPSYLPVHPPRYFAANPLPTPRRDSTSIQPPPFRHCASRSVSKGKTCYDHNEPACFPPEEADALFFFALPVSRETTVLTYDQGFARKGTSMVVISPSFSKGTSVASISWAPTRNDSMTCSRVLSWAFTPGRSTNHPIHQSFVFLITARYSMLYLTKGRSKSLQILRANSSTISLCLGTCVFRLPF